IDAVEEAIDIARTTDVHVEIVHLKCSGVDNWGKATPILDRIAAARAEGCDIDCDAYPYTAGANPLKNLLPGWVQIGGVLFVRTRLRLFVRVPRRFEWDSLVVIPGSLGDTTSTGSRRARAPFASSSP